MKWIEIIEIRSVNMDLVKTELQMLIKNALKKSDRPLIYGFGNISIGTDFSIHLVHESEQIDKDGSPLGQQLASGLKEFGLVNHRVWFDLLAK